MPSTNKTVWDQFSYVGYFVGLIIIVTGVIFPLAVMGLRSRSVFRRGALRPPAPFQ